VGVVIRKAAKADEKEFTRLCLELTAFNLAKRPAPLGYEATEARIKKRKENTKTLLSRATTEENSLVLLALADGKPVGYAKAFILEGSRGYVDEFFVSEGFRNLGIGKKLLEVVEDWLKTCGIDHIILNVFLWNRGAADFYRKEGFEEYYVCYKKELD